MARKSGSRDRAGATAAPAPGHVAEPSRLCERRNLGGQEADAMSGQAGHCRIARSRDSTIRVAARPCVGMLGTWTPDPPPYAPTGRRLHAHRPRHRIHRRSRARATVAGGHRRGRGLERIPPCARVPPLGRHLAEAVPAALSLAAAKQTLDDERSVLQAALDAGLSGPGRLHDLFVSPKP